MAFETIALPEVQRAWRHIAAHEPMAYALMTRSGPARISVVFAGGPPWTIAIVQYVEHSAGVMGIDKSTIDISTSASPTAYESVGVRENVEVYQRQHPEIERLSDAEFLRRLLLGAIHLESDPKRIGPPIAILEINSIGARWADQGKCQNIGDDSLLKVKPLKPYKSTAGRQ